MKEKTMYIFRLSLVLGLAGLTAACGQKAETPDSSEMTGSTDNMAMAPAAATPILAKGHGTVTAIDKGAGTITLAHGPIRSEEHTSELQSLMRISYAVFCLKKKKNNKSLSKTISNNHNHTLNRRNKAYEKQNHT